MLKKFLSQALAIFVFFSFVQISAQSDSSDFMISTGQARTLLLKSVILPGWGEHSLGYKTRGYVMNSSELGLWVGYAALIFMGQSAEKDMMAYAATHAGIDPSGKDNFYFTDIGNYSNIHEYNDQKLRYRQFTSLYPETAEYSWAWDSDYAREKFDKLRYKSQQTLHIATFALGGLILNRIVSMIDVIALTKDRLETPVNDFQALIVPQNGNMTLTLNFGLK